ncbi:MAG: DNA alkylation repair protein [Clostridiales bacterium]|jgi:3-methyladenine DNA glycosylase AlkD|nr:DNA alkylation repair protein [Clostridiales bacterium]
MSITETLAALRLELQSAAVGNEEYAEFNKRIVNTALEVMGVRTPDLRRIAKSHAKGLSAESLLSLMDSINASSFEEVLLVGLMTGYGAFSDEERRYLTRRYLTLCDSWGAIDMFVVRNKKYATPFWWDFAVEALSSEHEFTVRYGIIMLMSNFLLPEYIDCVFAALRTVKHDGYYVKMAMAWLYAEAAVRFYGQTLQEVQAQSKWVRNKALQKMTESRRFTADQKSEIRGLKV